MMAQRYFPGSNTCRGFVGFFQDLLPRTEQAGLRQKHADARRRRALGSPGTAG